MKYLLFLTLLGFLVESCGKIYPQKSISYGDLRKEPRDIPNATIQHNGKRKLDSLIIKSKKFNLNVAIPNSDTIHFLVRYTSKFGVYLQSKNRTKEQTFWIQTKKWSDLKTRTFSNNGPH